LTTASTSAWVIGSPFTTAAGRASVEGDWPHAHPAIAANTGAVIQPRQLVAFIWGTPDRAKFPISDRRLIATNHRSRKITLNWARESALEGEQNGTHERSGATGGERRENVNTRPAKAVLV
jgi:hypothetical protein